MTTFRQSPESPRVVRVGMVGTGMIAKVHSAAYSLVPVYFPSAIAVPEKTAVCDIDLSSAQQGARRLGWKNAVASFRELLERDDIDLIDITTPNHLHADMAIAAAESGKMIVCEKPLSTDLAGAHAMAKAARHAGVRTAVNFHKRRIPAVAYARALVASGELGDLLLIHGTYRQHFGLMPLPAGNWRHSPEQMGSLLGEIGSHLIDLARFLVGDFESVCGLTDRHAARRPEDVDATTVWSARLANKVLGSFEVCARASSEGDGIGFEIYGTRGAIRWHNRHAHVLEVSRESTPDAERGFCAIRMGAAHPFGDVFSVLSQDGLVDAKAYEIHDILKAFVGNMPYHPDFEDGLRAAEVVDAILRSADTRSWVDLKGAA